MSEITSELPRLHPVLVKLLSAQRYSASDLNGFSKLPHRAASGSRLKDLEKEEKCCSFKATQVNVKRIKTFFLLPSGDIVLEE